MSLSKRSFPLMPPVVRGCFDFPLIAAAGSSCSSPETKYGIVRVNIVRRYLIPVGFECYQLASLDDLIDD